MAEKVKLLHIVEAMGGGIFTYMVDLTNSLIENYDIYIAYSVRKQTPVDYRDYFDKRIHLIRVENFQREISIKKDWKAFLELKKIVARVCPDIIHLHSSKAGVLGRIAFNGRKIPLFYTPHGYSFLIKNIHPFKRNAYKIIERLCGKRGCVTISCSPGEDKESQKLVKKTAYVSNGINTSYLQTFIDKSERTEPHLFTVFTLGRICPQKNPFEFNRIALALPEVKFLWIGDGELRKVLTASNIQITGWMERKVALKYAMSADVFLLPSLWEGLPVSLLEAMYMKKICVVSDIIGNRDVIRNGENGFLCKETADYVEILQRIQNGEETEQAENAHSEIVSCYSVQSMAMQYSRIYRSKLKKK